ncbi:hypothetical protein [Actinoplanes palleronii]|uniref:DUF222 domain-containing protein n=1 Tax=Actinoplanes palleronii TaxID=113570 RepID=A0ABQ4BJ11_9ACTN|nr:hypothetical protein [Actinoplanes palleronii]GIE70670.1 hypothetical protein Apa02nite_067780 [Actinoplanes palleronii]
MPRNRLDDEDVDLVVDLARATIVQVAPAEMPVFEATATAYRADPRARRTPRAGDMLGFGADQVAAMAPVVLPIAAAALDGVLAELGSSMAERSKAKARDVVRRLLRRDGTPEIPPLSREQLSRVRRTAYEKAVSLQLPAETGALLADAVAGALALGDGG